MWKIFSRETYANVEEEKIGQMKGRKRERIEEIEKRNEKDERKKRIGLEEA